MLLRALCAFDLLVEVGSLKKFSKSVKTTELITHVAEVIFSEYGVGTIGSSSSSLIYSAILVISSRSLILLEESNTPGIDCEPSRQFTS